jgi:hypothetical protein
MSLYIIYVFHKTILFTDVDGLIFGKSIIITNSTDACMYDIHIATGNKQPGDCFLTNMTDLTFFSVDSHERVFYYVDHSMSSIKKVDMITKIEQILYMGTVGAETISGVEQELPTPPEFTSGFKWGCSVISFMCSVL